MCRWTSGWTLGEFTRSSSSVRRALRDPCTYSFPYEQMKLGEVYNCSPIHLEINYIGRRSCTTNLPENPALSVRRSPRCWMNGLQLAGIHLYIPMMYRWCARRRKLSNANWWKTSSGNLNISDLAVPFTDRLSNERNENWKHLPTIHRCKGPFGETIPE